MRAQILKIGVSMPTYPMEFTTLLAAKGATQHSSNYRWTWLILFFPFVKYLHSLGIWISIPCCDLLTLGPSSLCLIFWAQIPPSETNLQRGAWNRILLGPYRSFFLQSIQKSCPGKVNCIRLSTKWQNHYRHSSSMTLQMETSIPIQVSIQLPEYPE